jgi:hypothetical protein
MSSLEVVGVGLAENKPDGNIGRIDGEDYWRIGGVVDRA